MVRKPPRNKYIADYLIASSRIARDQKKAKRPHHYAVQITISGQLYQRLVQRALWDHSTVKMKIEEILNDHFTEKDIVKELSESFSEAISEAVALAIDPYIGKVKISAQDPTGEPNGSSRDHH